MAWLSHTSLLPKLRCNTMTFPATSIDLHICPLPGDKLHCFLLAKENKAFRSAEVSRRFSNRCYFFKTFRNTAETLQAMTQLQNHLHTNGGRGVNQQVHNRIQQKPPAAPALCSLSESSLPFAFRFSNIIILRGKVNFFNLCF